MITAAIIIGILLLFVLGASYYAYRMAFNAKTKNPSEYKVRLPEVENIQNEYDRAISFIKVLNEIEYEKIKIKSRDGKLLAGRYYHTADGSPVHIEFHGYRSRATTDFCGINILVRDLGHNTLLVDQRAHGESEGNTISFGIKERLDCLDWINYVIDRFGKDVKIILSGLSMGAATVLMASELDLPDNVVGIMADCPYSSPEEIIKQECAKMKLPPRLAYPFVRLGGMIFGGFDISSASARTAVKKAKVPILIIHGEDDDFVPCSMSRDIYDACASDKTIVTVPKATHGISYITDRPAYEKAVEEFFEKIL
jgi:fermentation-respiration switch protein FrsA (DUF1100 family)